MERVNAMLRSLNTEDLRQWAGAKIFNRGQSYIRNVDELSRTDDGALAAWVSGSDDYATSVGLDPEGELEYFCTCPYDDGPCKHSVAVLLAAAEQVKQKREIPLLDENDELFLTLFDDSDDDDYYCDKDDDDYDYDEDENWRDLDEGEQVGQKNTAMQSKGKARVRKILEGMNKDELTAVLIDLAGRYPEIERGLLEKEQLATGQVDKVVNALRREIRRLTDEPAWYNHWKGEGSIPDYSHVQEQLQALLAKGHADAVFQLGEELWTRGNRQVEESHDEGDTAAAISECMEVVLRSVPHTSLTPPQQLLWVIDRELEDEFSLLESGSRVVDSGAYTTGHWVEVADILESRLTAAAKPASARSTDSYHREKLMAALLKAYERSGRRERIIPLLEKEADACQSYGRLVDALLAAGEREKARQWCILGFNRTVESAPGIAGGLQKRLREMAHSEKNHGLVAAYRAQDFFDCPSRGSYKELRQAAEKVKVWPRVREGALQYLQTGRQPDEKGGGKGADWPLPTPEVVDRKSLRQGRGRFPDLDLLVGIALQEKRLDDAVALYGELRKTKRWVCDFGIDKAVANAVAGPRPQAALDIWRYIVDCLIGQVKPKAYEEAAVYLRSMCKVYQENSRAAEWQNLLSELRRDHKAKRRLMEVLDRLKAPTPLIS